MSHVTIIYHSRLKILFNLKACLTVAYQVPFDSLHIKLKHLILVLQNTNKIWTSQTYETFLNMLTMTCAILVSVQLCRLFLSRMSSLSCTPRRLQHLCCSCWSFITLLKRLERTDCSTSAVFCSISQWRFFGVIFSELRVEDKWAGRCINRTNVVGFYCLNGVAIVDIRVNVLGLT